MNISQQSAAFTIWQSRKIYTGGDKAYFVYLFTMVALTALAPLVRALYGSRPRAIEALLFPRPFIADDCKVTQQGKGPRKLWTKIGHSVLSVAWWLWVRARVIEFFNS